MPSEQLSKNLKNRIEEEKRKREEEKNLQDFRREIASLLERQKKEKLKAIPKIFVEHLNIKDALMWGKINNPELNSDTLNELKEYQKDEENSQNDLGKYMKELRNSTNHSRVAFLALFISKIIEIQYKKEKEEREINLLK